VECMQLRERDWCNVITAHEGETAAYSWRLSHLSLGEHVLRPRRKRERGVDAAPDAPVTAVAISCCGNFGLVGTAAGRVDRYNMQSGLHRGSYCRCAAADPLYHVPLSSYDSTFLTVSACIVARICVERDVTRSAMSQDVM
jgi:hypothetical protein